MWARPCSASRSSRRTRPIPKRPQDAIFEEIDGKAEAQDGTKHSADKHFWFHRTDSLDYAIVLEGEITLLVDEGEATLKAGDVAIQRATSHAWSNRTDRDRASGVRPHWNGTPLC